METKAILMNYICPGAGVILANIVFSSPVKSLRKALRDGSLGNLNPTPWAFMTGNCLGWVAYSFLTSDMFILAANAPGVILSIWLNSGAAKLQYHEMYEAASISMAKMVSSNKCAADRGGSSNQLGDDPESESLTDTEEIQQNLHSLTSQEFMTISIVSFWILLLSTISFLSISHETKILTVGITVNVNLIVFFGAPLSTIYTVITTKNSSSIHRMLMMTNTFNAVFWLIYGLALMNPIIILPNAAGVLFGIIQILLACWYPCENLEIDGAVKLALFEESMTSDDVSTVASDTFA